MKATTENTKSVTVVQEGKNHGGFDVRVRLTSGEEKLLAGGYPYTKAQAEMACENLQRDIKRHGEQEI